MSCVAPAERLFLPEIVDCSDLRGSSLALRGETAAHMGRVLRIRLGTSLWFGDGQGHLRRGIVSETSKREVSIEFDGELEYFEPPAQPVILALGMLQNREDLEHALSGAVEAGVDKIILFRAARSNKDVPDLLGTPGKRFRKILREASAQARRSWIPSLEKAASLSSICALDAAIFMADPDAGSPSVETTSLASTSLVTLVGPEGGFDEKEKELLEASQANGLWLGPSVLRARTAVSIAVHRLILIRSSFK